MLQTLKLNGRKPGEIHLPLRFSRLMWPAEAKKKIGCPEGTRHVKPFQFWLSSFRAESEWFEDAVIWVAANAYQDDHVVVFTGS